MGGERKRRRNTATKTKKREEGEDSIKEPSSLGNDLMSEARNVFAQHDCVMRR